MLFILILITGSIGLNTTIFPVKIFNNEDINIFNKDNDVTFPLGNDEWDWPLEEKDVKFLPVINIVHLSKFNIDTEYNFLASIPMSVFHFNGSVYQSLLISDDIYNLPTKYLMEDWKTYLDNFNFKPKINFIGNIKKSIKVSIMKMYDTNWDRTLNISGNAISIANKIALKDWKNASMIVIAPYLKNPRSNDIVSISNAASLASLYNCPLIFTKTNSLGYDTVSTLKELNVTKAIIVDVGNSLKSTIKSELKSNGIVLESELKNSRMVVSKIREIADHSIMCCVLKNWQNLPASLSAARYGGFVLFIPNNIKNRINIIWTMVDFFYWEEIKDILRQFNISTPEWWKGNLPKYIENLFCEASSEFYKWLKTVNGSDPDKMETVITFHEPPQYKLSIGFGVVFEKIIIGDPSKLTNPGAITGRMPLDYIGNIALVNRGSMYKALIFANPRPYHATLAMNAYECMNDKEVGTSHEGPVPDKWGQNHIVNEIFGWPYRGWCSENEYFPWQDIHNNSPDLSPIYPPGPGEGPGHDPGIFTSFLRKGYEAHFHSGAYYNETKHPANSGVESIGFVEDANIGTVFLYFSCHGLKSYITVLKNDNGIATDPPNNKHGPGENWSEPYWPDDDGWVYNGADKETYYEYNIENEIGNLHGTISGFNACLMANGIDGLPNYGIANERLLEHGGTASFSTFTSCTHTGSGWWWCLFTYLITNEGWTIGEASTYATARVSPIYAPNGDTSGDSSVQYICYGDPLTKIYQPDWTIPIPSSCNTDFNGHLSEM